MGAEIPLILVETIGIDRIDESVTGGIPVKKGALFNTHNLCIFDNGNPIPVQTKVLSEWPDKSIKWLLLDFNISIKTNEKKKLVLKSGFLKKESDLDIPLERLKIIERLRLVDSNKQAHIPKIGRKVIETKGPNRTTVRVEGSFMNNPLIFIARFNFYKNNTLRLGLTIRNPQPAEHINGFWDLGDKGSVLFEGLSLRIIDKTEKYYKIDKEFNKADNVLIYQDSSGNKNWKSRNHVDRFNKMMNSFKGYKVYSDKKEIDKGEHAQPVVKSKKFSIAIKDFWQNFPKAIEFDKDHIIIRLFPKYYNGFHEIQGGEQKTHTIYIDFNCNDLDWIKQPLVLMSTPEYYSETKAIPYLVPSSDIRYKELIDVAIEGENSFEKKNELIDEFGWRNFGDIYADHEAVNEKGLISHYNNQYDIIYGSFLQFFKSGNIKWLKIADALAKHVRDIDIYHTDKDRNVYNGGLFWHTCHYMNAATCTHRSFSKKGIKKMDKFNYGSVGGGPANEHNYASGMMFHYFLTGDRLSKEAALSLANWVINMDDGSRSKLNKLNKKPTGKASQSASIYYHGPGRGSGNSVNVLLDGFEVSKKKKYLLKAEELIKRCIHPSDDISKNDLDNIEYRWYYLIFLQNIGRYIDLKYESNELDYMFYYAKESLIHYAEWMLKNEVPYFDVLDKVEIPTETWPAHDIRKSNVFDFAYKYSGDEKFKEKSEYFFNRCIDDLNKFETKTLLRPMAVIMNFSAMHDSFKMNDNKIILEDKTFDFGRPMNFKQQGYYVYKIRDLVRKLRK